MAKPPPNDRDAAPAKLSDGLAPRGWWWVAAFFALFLGYYALHGPRITPDPASDGRFYLLTGDEPHYLLLAHSIAFDGDIDLGNNKEEEDYKAFYARPVSGYTKNRDFWLRYVKGKLRDAPDAYWEGRNYSVCPVGMPLLIAPAYRIGYAWGQRVRFCVALFFHALAAGLVLLVADLTWRLTGRRGWTIFCAACFAFSAPLLFYTVPVFPDLPAAFFIVTSLWLLLRLEQAGKGPRSIALVASLGIVAGFLPWLHMRLWPHALLIALFTAAVVLGRRESRLALACVGTGAFLLMIIPLMYYYALLFGAPYPVSTHPPVAPVVGLKSGWLGLWLDRDNGLLWYAPLALFAIPGALLLWTTRLRVARLVILLIALNWLLLGMFSDWRGGLCPPLRYWLPVLPLLMAPAVWCVASARGPWLPACAAVAGVFGVAVGLLGMLNPARLYAYRHPVLPYWKWTHFYDIAPRMFPDAQPADYARAVVLAIVVAVFCVGVVRSARRRPGTPAAQDSGVDVLSR